MSEDRCPFCGAGKTSEYPEFACGTYLSQISEGMAGQSDECKDRQITKLKVEAVGDPNLIKKDREV